MQKQISAVACGLMAMVSSTLSVECLAQSHDKIDALDINFRNIYAMARSKSVELSEPIFIVRRESVTLVNNGQTTVDNYFPLQSDTLKVVDHVGLAILVALFEDPQHPNLEHLDKLKALKDAVAAARSQIDSSSLAQESLARQDKMLDMCVGFIDKTLAAKGCTPDELHDFVRAIQPSTNQNIKESVGLELSALYQAVARLKEKMTPEEWKKVHVVIFTSHMARDRQMYFQYFARLLDQNEEGDRVILMENGSEDKPALDLVGTHALDAQIAEAYFGDAWRMHRDLLSAAASEYLDEHPVK